MTGRYLVNKPVPPADKSRFNALESNISQKLDSWPRSDTLNFEILRTFWGNFEDKFWGGIILFQITCAASKSKHIKIYKLSFKNRQFELWADYLSLIILICETESSSYSVTNSNCTHIKSRRRVCLRLGSSREPLCTLELEAWKGNISAACLYSYGALVFLGRQSNRQFSRQNHFGRGLSANNCLLIFLSHVLVDILDWTSRWAIYGLS